MFSLPAPFLTHFSYGPGPHVPDVVMSAVMGAILIILAIALCIGAVLYAVQAFSLYQIALRRKISLPWLAWIPLGNLWICGSLSDQYRYLTAGKYQHRRVILPVLGGLACALSVAAGRMLHHLMQSPWSSFGYHRFPSPAETLAILIVMSLSICFAIACSVYFYICLYNLYRSCNPSVATVYLVISIFFPVALPFLLLASRKNELGMPPRREPFSGGSCQSPASGQGPSFEQPSEAETSDPKGSMEDQAL